MVHFDESTGNKWSVSSNVTALLAPFACRADEWPAAPSQSRMLDEWSQECGGFTPNPGPIFPLPLAHLSCILTPRKPLQFFNPRFLSELYKYTNLRPSPRLPRPPSERVFMAYCGQGAIFARPFTSFRFHFMNVRFIYFCIFR